MPQSKLPVCAGQSCLCCLIFCILDALLVAKYVKYALLFFISLVVVVDVVVVVIIVVVVVVLVVAFVFVVVPKQIFSY